MLSRIEKNDMADARRLLLLLCFASRPLTVREAIDGLAVELTNPARLNVDRRFETEDDLRYICPGFIDIGVISDSFSQTVRGRDIPATVRIAHYSVQEYLLSGRICTPELNYFALQPESAHAEIAQICLAYLLEPGIAEQKLQPRILLEYPMARFAAMYWCEHFAHADKSDPDLEHLAWALFAHKERGFHNWIRLYDVEFAFQDSTRFDRSSQDMASPLYYASLLGFAQLVARVVAVDAQKDINALVKIINAQGGYYGNALQAASTRGYEQVVRLLIDKGAEVNTRGGKYGNALRAASTRGHEQVVRLLIDKGAEVNTRGGRYGNALRAASTRGHEAVVQLLVAKRADVNAQGGHYGNALQAASSEGHKAVVQLLLAEGADVNAQGGHYGNALQAASTRGHEAVVQLLLAEGADVTTR